jgi:hypothetical protein
LNYQVHFDEQMQSLDFRTNSYGFCYIRKDDTDNSQNRRVLAKSHNNNPKIKIQALVDYTNKELFNSIQQFSIIELNIQVIPIESVKHLVQYIERVMISMSHEDANPFTKELIVDPTIDPTLHAKSFLSTLKTIPKVGEKTAKILVENFKSKNHLI